MSDDIFYYIEDNLKFDKPNVIVENIIIKCDFEYCVKIQIYDEYYYNNEIENQIDLKMIYSDEFDLFMSNMMEGCNLTQINHKSFEIFDNFELLTNDLRLKINLIEKNNQLNLNYKLNYFENGYRYVIINVYKKKNYIANKTFEDEGNIISCDESSSYISVNDTRFEDKIEYELKEWIIDLISVNKKLINQNKKLINDNNKLINDNNRLINDNNKLKKIINIK